MGWTLRLRTLAEQRAQQKATPKASMRAAAAAIEKATARDERKAEDQFKREVYTRDKGRCRCCDRPVKRTIENISERAERHHLHGRIGVLRYLARAAILVCRDCHRRLTGEVNDKLVVVPTKYFTVKGQRLMDGAKPVRFEKAA